MRPNDESCPADIPRAPSPGAPRHASQAEVEEALGRLSGEDHAKLMMIARIFCRSRHLATSVMEPDELLSQAVLKTLACEDGKRWNMNVSLVKHLDRAMENISGHLAKERTKIVPFSDGLSPDEESLHTDEGEDQSITAEDRLLKLEMVFGEDNQAVQVFSMRMDRLPPREVQVRLGISAKEYETVNRRILRKISMFVKKSKV